LTEAQSNFKALQESKDVLDQEMKVANDHIKEMEESEQEMLDTIERVRGDLGPQLSREHFQESYGELRNQIQYWSQDFFKGDIHGHPSAFPALRKLSDECNDYLNSPELRVKLVQAYIWAVLVREVFANIDGLWWASPYRNELYGLRALLEPSGE
jgi:hypothetical protein